MKQMLLYVTVQVHKNNANSVDYEAFDCLRSIYLVLNGHRTYFIAILHTTHNIVFVSTCKKSLIVNDNVGGFK